MSNYIQVLTTTETKEDSEKIAEALAEKRLAACMQIIGPIKSAYRWKGEITKAEEWICAIKTRSALHEKVEKAILEVHPYEVPEIISMPIVAGYERYLEWLDENTEVGF